MLPLESSSTWQLLKQTAKTQAIAGAAAGTTLGVFRGIASVRRNQLRDGYDVMVEGMTQIGTGAVLGVVGSIAATVAGVSVAAFAGRGILTVAIPPMASAIASSSVQDRVYRVIRPLSERFARGLEWTLQGRRAPEAASRVQVPRP